MNQISLNEDFVKKYLLGDIDEGTRQRLEERLLTDEEFFEGFSTLEDRLEDELIDEYVGGEMSERASAGFENVFLAAPHRVEKLRLVRGLHDYVNSPAPASAARAGRGGADAERVGLIAGLPAIPESAEMRHAAATRHTGGSTPRWWPLPPLLSPHASLALMIALVAAIIGVGVFYAKTRRLEAELRALQQRTPEQSVLDELSRLRARNEELAADLRRVEAERRASTEPTPAPQTARETVARASQPKPLRVFSLALSLVRSRAGDGQTIPELKLPASAASLRLLLKLDAVDPADYKSFHATVSKRDRTPIKSSAVFKSGAGSGEQHVTMTLPARRLTAGDYVVRLNGRQADGTESLIGVYDFRIVRQ